jgi:hypothetical protein
MSTGRTPSAFIAAISVALVPVPLASGPCISLRPRLGDALSLAFEHHLALEGRYRRDHGQKKFACGRTGLDVQIEDMEIRPLALYETGDLQEVLCGPRESVELGHDEAVPLADEIEAGFELRPFFDRRNLLVEYLLADSGLKVTKLGLHPGPLIQGACSPVSDPQSPLLSR